MVGDWGFRISWHNMPPLQGYVGVNDLVSIIISSLQDFSFLVILHIKGKNKVTPFSIIISSLRDFGFLVILLITEKNMVILCVCYIPFNYSGFFHGPD